MSTLRTQAVSAVCSPTLCINSRSFRRFIQKQIPNPKGAWEHLARLLLQAPVVEELLLDTCYDIIRSKTFAFTAVPTSPPFYWCWARCRGELELTEA